MLLHPESSVRGPVTSLTTRSGPDCGMPNRDTIASVKEELTTTRAEEAEALRRAHHLRAIGDYAEIRAAMQDATRIHSRVADLEHELTDLQHG
jgi:hypothetical protein